MFHREHPRSSRAAFMSIELITLPPPAGSPNLKNQVDYSSIEPAIFSIRAHAIVCESPAKTGRTIIISNRAARARRS
ncbi:hypothetical protein [Burkholderia thailandensis]|uniref:hypothetical protein n=1 Tax=Burkholderia thailandensis TaxID=57975 RepID=UPI000AAEB4C5|nr:hypothetical protein [Burkholderia thailandensis]MBS2130848.1 hypothetical protein [Burkholderia thailandensis]MCS3399999.1 hypothetical protein [Burkholderia thailandensis]MCS6472088.1 hypothetical protein [Burkholderia thailandensis]MCS6478887.1 hypothetical protein [Burkholderia thailandensis]MCS6510391.1 hypothetical protein [Burkholderia thailandensis]